MKECFICYDILFHSVKFGCFHEICIHCFMKLESNLCPYCRCPIYQISIKHYSNHIPPFLKEICKVRDILSFVLLQIVHNNVELMNWQNLLNDIKTWNIGNNIKTIYKREINILFQQKFLNTTNRNILIGLLYLSFLSLFIKNSVIQIIENGIHKQLVLYPIYIMINLSTLGYIIYLFVEYKKSCTYNYLAREKIKIENLMS